MNILVAVHSAVAAWNIPAEYVDSLQREFPHHTFLYAATEADVIPLIGMADAAFMGEVTTAQLGAAPQLRWLHTPAAGVGGMLFGGMRDSAVILSNSRGMSGDTIAEHVVALVLALFRKLPLAIRSQAAHKWAQDEAFAPPPTRMIMGASALVVGLGGIGAAVASRFAALGASVTGIRRDTTRGAPQGVTAVAGPERLLEVLPAADVVVLAAPHTAATRHLLGAREIGAMRNDAVLINVSRGRLVDEAALAAALTSHAIGGAGLDVFDHEPLDPVSPFWDCPNVIITPHTSGFRADHWDAATRLFAENLRRFDAGQPLLNVVDKLAGY